MSRFNDFAFHWRAKFTDGTVLKQFEEDGSENPFHKVQEKEDALEYFWLEHQGGMDPLNIGVNLTNGEININEFVITPMKGDIPWEVYSPEYRVINFRRNRQNFDLDGELIGEPTVDFFIGWQVTHEGVNYKKLIKIGSDGTFGMS